MKLIEKSEKLEHSGIDFITRKSDIALDVWELEYAIANAVRKELELPSNGFLCQEDLEVCVDGKPLTRSNKITFKMKETLKR